MAFISSSTIQIIAAIAFLASSATAQISSGYATYSNGDGGVCSGGGGLPSVSLNAAQFANGAACGQCVQISGTGSGAGKDPVSTAPYIARIGNVCPQCNFGDIDLQESGDGKFGITWSFVGCPGAGRKLIEEPFQGDKNVYTNGEHSETEQEAAAPKQSEKSEKHFIVQQAQNGHFIHQKQDQPVAPSTIEKSTQDNTAEVQAPSAKQVEEELSAKATQEADDVHPTTQDVEQEEVVQKTSRRLLMN